VTLLRFRRRAAALLALASMALNAAWPLLANAKPVVPEPPSEICSSTGLNHAAGGAPAAPEKGLHASHCTLCPFSAERGAAIPYTAPLPLPQAVPSAQVFALGDAPRPVIAPHPAAPPRGPPVLC